MRWWYWLLFFFTGCTATVTVTPLKRTTKYPHTIVRHNSGSKIRIKAQTVPLPAGIPKPSPLPPDERVMDIVKQLDEAKKK